MNEVGHKTSIREAIDAMAKARPEAEFLISPETGRRVDFAELQRHSVLLSDMLRQAGLERGDKVAFLMDNGLLTAQLFLGAMYGGYVAVPLNVRAGVVQLSYMLDHCDAKVVFVEDQYRVLLREALGSVRRDIRVIAADVDSQLPAFEAVANSSVPVAPGADDVALLMYSSGSTGKPKGALHTHSSVLAHGRNSIEAHQLTSTDRSLLVLPLYHINAECVTLIPTLLSGGSVVVAHRFVVSKFWDWVDDLHVTWSALVPTIISELVDWDDPGKDRRQAAFQRIRFLRSSSAPLSPSLHRQFLDKFNLPLLQAMGSTEGGNVFSNPVPPGKNKIGSPGLPWGFEARIVDREGVDVPAGESGEVLLRGPALMMGYYKDSEGTAAVVDSAGWLHTGDLARRDEDGYFFVVGRSKELIIKSGVNIAPRQIDEVLESHPAVLEAAAVGVPDRYVGEDVIAFVVLRTRNEAGERELLTFCEERLGHFKAPTRIHFIDDLPKGPSGKVQRLRLLEAAVASASEGEGAAGGRQAARNGSAAPLSLIEQTIASIWVQILAQPEVDRQANFFALGGHSLFAIQCLSQLREKLPVVLSLTDFFENPTVAQQAALVWERLSAGDRAALESTAAGEEMLQKLHRPAAEEAILRRDRSLPCPLSPAQQRLWFLESMNPGLSVYNESEAVRLRGELRVDLLEQALNAIVARHEILRTTIQATGEEPQAVVHESWPLRLKQIDLSRLAPAPRQAEVERLLISEPQSPYDLQTEPAFRATLLHLGGEENVFILMVHHIICDRLSLGILWRELGTLYDALLHGQASPLPPLPIQYGDYATWQQRQIQKGGFEQDLSFWKETLAGAPNLLDLPTDRPRPSAMSYRGMKRQFRLGAALANGLRNLSRREQTSLFTIFTAALQSLLHRYTCQDDILLGISIADRDRPELQPLIGFFVDTQVLRTDFSGNPSFRELLGRLQKGMLGVYSHRSVPFGEVVEALKLERNLSYSPLFQVMLNWRDRDAQLQFVGFPGLTLEPLLAQSMISKFDLQVFLTDAVDDIWLEMEYSTDLFDDARIARMVEHLRTLLESVMADPDRPIAVLPLLTEAERQHLLYGFNDTQAAYPSHQRVHELFEAQVVRTPDATAVIFESSSLSYAELNRQANQLAHYLLRIGVQPNTMVGICVERSIEMVVALFAIWKAGCAYVPLDPAFPEARLSYMVEDSGMRVLLTHRGLEQSIQIRPETVVCLDSDWSKIAALRGDSEGLVQSKSDDLAYVLYTSGSTGKPKGVEIPHSALVNFLVSMQREPGFSSKDTLLAVTTLSFDIAGLELYLPMITGGRVVIASREDVHDPARLMELMRKCGCTVMQATPATWRALVQAGWEGSPNLKVLCGGEALVPDLAKDLLPRCNELWNMYGPTETTVWSTVHKVSSVTGSMPIGKPIANTRLYILNAQLELCPVGAVGELYIGGDGLARGYLHREELTRERFIPSPFIPGARLYRTGDLARWLPDGTVECLGRVDNQVKIRGFRIELGEIEARLAEHPAIREAVVVAREETPGNVRLIAYVVRDHGQGNAEKSGQWEELQAELTTQWQTVWDETYRTAVGVEDPQFNTAGWQSSYTGQPIPAAEMREWVENAVARIASLGPRRVLEIGCGTGLLLLRIAPHCARYVGWDLSGTVVENLRRHIGNGLPQVELLQRQADDFSGVESHSLDAVVLNSVTQYFPGIDYLVRVLEKASKAVKPGGFIYVGDVLNLQLLEVLHTSVQLSLAPADLPMSQLWQRIQKLAYQEEELMIAPEFFNALSGHLSGVGRVEIQLKRGRSRNQMTRFRYDVVLHMGSPRAEASLEVWDWEQRKLTIPSLQDHLAQNHPAGLRVTAIPNARLERELKCMELVERQEERVTVSRVLEAVKELAPESGTDAGIEPEDLWSLGDRLPYAVEITWSDPSRLGCYDAILRRKDNGETSPREALPAVHATGAVKPWISYANEPLKDNRAEKLVPSLRDFLKNKLPEYMVPSAFVVLEKLPLTPNGKLDRNALPAPGSERPELSANYVAASSPTEKILADIWAKALALQKVGIHDNFFDIGGHSLLLVKVQAQVCKALNATVSIVEMFQYPTISSLARHLSQPAAATGRLQKAQVRTRLRKEALGRQRELKG